MRPTRAVLNAFRHAPSIWSHAESGERLVILQEKHFEYVLPLMKKYVENEWIGKQANNKFQVETALPLLRNCTEKPISVVGLDKNNNVISVVLQEVVYRKEMPDNSPKEEIPEDEMDSYYKISNILKHGETLLFQQKPNVKRVAYTEFIYTLPEYRLRGMNSRIGYEALCLVLNQKESLKLDGYLTLTTSTNSEKASQKAGLETIGAISTRLYKEGGNSLVIPTGQEVARVRFLDFKNFKKSKFLH